MALRPLLHVRALLRVVEIRSRERLFDVLDSERKTVVRMRLQQPALGKPDDTAAARKGEAGRRARGKAVRCARASTWWRCAATTRRSGVWGARSRTSSVSSRRSSRSSTRRSRRRGTPGGTPTRIAVPLEARQRAEAAAAAVLTALFGVIEANLDGTIADIDSEFLHDLRVAVRRTRAVQRELKGAFAAGRARPLPRGVSVATAGHRRRSRPGRVRARVRAMRALVPEAIRPDLDVLPPCSPAPRNARRRMVRALRSDRTHRLLADWPSFLDGLEFGRSPAGPPPATRSGRSPASGSRRCTGGWSGWATRSTPPARRAAITSCASRARSSATCSSCSAPRCSPAPSSSR